jgi:uncharacterized protein YciI
MARFVRQIAFISGDERRLAVRPSHRQHLRELLAQGRLVMAGPWAEDDGALLVYEVADEAEMQELIGRDPYTKAGVVEEVSLRRWTQILPA